MTNSSIEAWLRVTLVNFILAVISSESCAAGAFETIDPICAGSPIKTGALSAVWYVGLTEKASEAWFTGTSIAVDIISAGTTILAGYTLTFIQLSRTACPREAWQTTAAE